MTDASYVFNVSTYMPYAIIPASAIIIILILLQRRSRPNPCGYHIPGIVVPMRFLDGYEDRWSYALAFGSITGFIISVLTQSSDTDQSSDSGSGNGFFCNQQAENGTGVCSQVWAKTLQLQAQSLLASLVCAPPFVCISTPYKLVGAIMGFFYSVFWVVIYIVGAVRSEKYLDRRTGTLLLLRDLPVVLCFIGLCIRSLWAIYICYSTKRVRVEKEDKLVEQHQVDHVVSLFRPEPAEVAAPEGLVESVKEKAKAQLFPYFKLPTRIICVAFVQAILVYYLGVTLVALGFNIRQLIKSALQLTDGNMTRQGHTMLSILLGVYATSVVAGLLSSTVYIALFVINYRINMINIYKGRKHTYMDLNARSSSEHMASSLRLPGYQIAYTLWGFGIIFTMLAIILLILSYGIYFLNEFDFLVPFLISVAQSLSVPVSTILIFYLQVFLVSRFLLQPKLNEGDKHHPLNVNNRHVYEAVAYTLVFVNLLVGLVSALFRTLKSFLLGLVFLARLDRCLMMRGFESMDPGYMAYVGSLLVDNAHNNPVMRTFCALMVRLTSSPDTKEQRGIACLLETAREGSNSRAARRWHLAYTLLKNPDLLPRRKLALLLARGLHDENDDNDDDDNATPHSNHGYHNHNYHPDTSASASGEDSNNAEVSVKVVGSKFKDEGKDFCLQSVLECA